MQCFKFTISSPKLCSLSLPPCLQWHQASNQPAETSRSLPTSSPHHPVGFQCKVLPIHHYPTASIPGLAYSNILATSTHFIYLFFLKAKSEHATPLAVGVSSVLNSNTIKFRHNPAVADLGLLLHCCLLLPTTCQMHELLSIFRGCFSAFSTYHLFSTKMSSFGLAGKDLFFFQNHLVKFSGFSHVEVSLCVS